MVRRRQLNGAFTGQQVRIAFGVVLAVCLLCSIATLLGFRLGFGSGIYRIVPATGEAARGSVGFALSYSSTLLQWACVGGALMTAVLGLTHYSIRRDVSVLAIAMGLAMAGVLEALHVLAIDVSLFTVESPGRMLPLTWALTRIGKATILFGLMLYLLLAVRQRVELSPRKAVMLVVCGVAVTILLGVFAVMMISVGTVGSAPAVQAARVIQRPWDFVALLLFLAGAAYVYPRFHTQFPTRVSLALLVSIVPEVLCQLHACLGAGQFFDRHFEVATLFKALAYALPTVGLLADYRQSYEDEAEAVAKFRQAERRMKSRLLELEDSSVKLQQEEADWQSAEKAIRVLDRAIAASSCGIIITDPKVPGNQIIYVNPSFERITGYPADQAIGRRLDFLYAEDPEQAAVLEVAEAIAEARECRVVMRNYRKDGRMFWSELDIAPIPDENGLLSHYIGIMTDITDRVRAEEEHKKFTARLELTNRELEDFVHVASHDLQEPLRKVQVFSDRLLAKCEDSLPKEGKLYLERMQNSVRRMDRLIRDLLTYSRIGRKEQELSNVDLNAIVNEVISDLEVRIEETGGKVEIAELPELEADATQMRQLLQNLIGNALKFHRPGVPPVVKLSSQQTMTMIGGQPVPHYRIIVEDNGIGFEEKYVERIFTVFQRLHTGSVYEGTGLGLTVCRKIADRHGGTIEAHSVPGQGSTFVVTLPVSRRFV